MSMATSIIFWTPQRLDYSILSAGTTSSTRLGRRKQSTHPSQLDFRGRFLRDCLCLQVLCPRFDPARAVATQAAPCPNNLIDQQLLSWDISEKCLCVQSSPARQPRRSVGVRTADVAQCQGRVQREPAVYVHSGNPSFARFLSLFVVWV